MFDDEFYSVIGDILEELIDKQIREDALQYVNTDD